MADVHRRAVSSAPRLTPEEIANRGFASAFRGISETEVRNFLKRVADEIAAMRDREAELAALVDDLRAQLRNPAPLTEQQLLDSLGEETARVLRSAQEAAEEIRSRAEERAGTLVREAQDEAARRREESETTARERLEGAERVATERTEAAEAAATRLREDAERAATETRAAAEQEAQAVREAASAESEAEIEAAKETGRGLVNEARAVRERVLADLGRRRNLLQVQVDELRAGRDRLLDGYRVVKRTLADATQALAGVEARATAELSGPAPAVDVPPVEGELETLAGEQAPSAEVVTVEIDAVAALVGEPGESSGAEVDALFARLKAEASEHATPPVPDAEASEASEVSEVSESADAAEGPERVEIADAAVAVAPGAEASEAEVVGPKADDVAGAPAGGPEDGAEPGGAPEAEPTGDDAVRAERAAVLDPLGREVARKAKRALQDEQNDLLDRIRKVKGTPKALDVLTPEEAQHRAWCDVLRAPLTAAYAGGYGLGGGGKTRKQVPAPLLDELAADLVVRLRDRLVAAIDDAADTDDVTQRLGARYREFKGQDLDRALGDALAAAWAKGTFDASPAGTRLRWVPEVEGRCPDCDDNALEPTVRGEPFPTGTPHPPAHPGCRCLLVPEKA